MIRHFPTTALLCGLLTTALASTNAWAQTELDADQRSAVELLPASCLAVVEMRHPDQLLTTLTEHNVWKKIKQQPQYTAAISNPGYRMFLGIRSHIETQIGMKWREAYDTLLASFIIDEANSKAKGGKAPQYAPEELAALMETD